MVLLIFIFFTGLCWGSFLNVIAYRILHDKKFFTARSQCPSCHKIISWYDNIPLVSWILLRGRCRSCQAPISWLYPFIELVTGLVLIGLVLVLFDTLILSILSEGENVSKDVILGFSAYLIFFSALIAATRTDLELMLIPQCFSMWLVPLGLAAAYFDLLYISFLESMIGAFFGYFLLFIVAWFFKKATGKDGLGVGDMELLALIGSFLGPIGVWFSLMIGSFSGLLIGVILLLITKKGGMSRIPFGPFLALGAALYFFFEPQLLSFLLIN